MIRTMIVEDEPAAKRFLMSMIGRCPDFFVVATAEDGLDAADMLLTMPVDIVITDVQMARMNGIELANWISRERPDILTMIVSGHDDFAYARGAIQAGVVEYLLKPIVPEEFEVMMCKLRDQVLDRRRAVMEKELLRAARGRAPHAAESAWNDGCYWLGAVRLGGKKTVPISALGAGAVMVEIAEERTFLFALGSDTSREQLHALLAAWLSEVSYYTARLAHAPMPDGLGRLPTLIKEAAELAVLGQRQILFESASNVPTSEFEQEERRALQRIRHVITGGMHGLEQALAAVFDVWEAHRCPLISVESRLRRILEDVHDHAPASAGAAPTALALRVSDACACANTFDTLLDACVAFCSERANAYPKNDSIRLAQGIQGYIREHIGEPLSTQSVCAVFGISGSYLSQLFRKHVRQSFVEYVTQQRVERARDMLLQFPDMPLKDIAQALGFSDQFYFSKVFRMLTGVPPSEYRK